MRTDADFQAAYRELEKRMKALAESDGHVFLPSPEPVGPVDYLFVCMEPSLGRWARDADKGKAKVEAGFKNFISSIDDAILHFSIRHYLCGPAERYHITDLAKGAMLVKHAALARAIIYLTQVTRLDTLLVMVTSTAPKTLQQAIVYFSNPEIAFAEIVKFRWPNGVVTCPTCGGTDVYFTKSRRIWMCKTTHPKQQFSVKVGSIMEDSPIGIDKWLIAMWLISSAKNGISSYELARSIGVTQKTAWFLLHRIRLAMQRGTFMKMGGQVEIDETYIGGKARFMHKAKKARVITGTGGMGKVAVMGLLERHGPDGHSTVRAHVVKTTKKRLLHAAIRANVEQDASIFTDALKSYDGLNEDYVHQVIDHAEAYVDGQIHTNGMENFWSLLKRAIKGTYVSVEPFHLFRYLDEQVFRFNSRKMTDAARFVNAATAAFGKRLTFNTLTGKDLPQTC